MPVCGRKMADVLTWKRTKSAVVVVDPTKYVPPFVFASGFDSNTFWKYPRNFGRRVVR